MKQIQTRSKEKIYHLDKTVSNRQFAAFVIIQLFLISTLLWLSITILSLFLSQFFDPFVIYIVGGIYGIFVIFWQLTYVFRVYSMKRAVLVNRNVPNHLKIAMATTIVPSREFALLFAKLEGMIQVDACGNQLELWVLDEEDDPRVRTMVDSFNQRYQSRGVTISHFSRKGIDKYNEIPSGQRFKNFQRQQKGGNINAWLEKTRDQAYDLVTFLDLDHIPKADFYKKVLPYFQDSEVAFLQGPETFHNREQNFITKAASFERDTFFGLIHRSFFGLGMPVIVGSHTTFRSKVFEMLGGYYPVHLTEDYLIMLRLRALGLQGIFIDKELAIGELPSTWDAYLGQQQRWASGGLDLLIRYLPSLWKNYSGKERLFLFVLLNYYAWGSFFLLSKFFLFSLLVGGLTLQLDYMLVLFIVAYSMVAIGVNFLWERQFFIEPSKKKFLFANMVMNNFLGGLFFLSLIKAIFKPNTSFNVTVKSGSKLPISRFKMTYPKMITALVTAEILGLFFIWQSHQNTLIDSGSSTYDILIFPLMISTLANLILLMTFRRCEEKTHTTKHSINHSILNNSYTSPEAGQLIKTYAQKEGA